MTSINRWVGVLLLTVVLVPGWAVAASAKKYQVTGKVLELTDSVITVEKGTEKWEINRDVPKSQSSTA